MSTVARLQRPRESRPWRPQLRLRLDALASTYGPGYLDSDPLQVPHRYPDPGDREVAALVAASLAFGNVPAIVASATRVLESLGPRPARGLRELAMDSERRRRPPGRMSGPLHRWVRGEDMERFLVSAGRLREEHGTLGSAFARGLRPADPDVGPALAAFVESLRARDPLPGSPRSRGMDALLPTPVSGSACKRWNLLLRWCARPDDDVDLGLWDRVPPRLLLLPLDVHVGRIVRRLRLTRRRTVDWKAAQEATAALRRFDPEDPVRYDFSLCRLGILGIDAAFPRG